MLFLWHKENGNDDYTSSVEAFMNTMQIVWHKCKDKVSKFWQIATGEIWMRIKEGVVGNFLWLELDSV